MAVVTGTRSFFVPINMVSSGAVPKKAKDKQSKIHGHDEKTNTRLVMYACALN